MFLSPKKKIKILLAIIFFSLFLGFNIYSAGRYNDKLRVNFFDVGQGDSALIQTPEGVDILIDGGPDKTILEKLRTVMPFYDRHIDYLIITHEHEDHIRGILEVMSRYDVDKVYYNKPGNNSNVYPAIFDKFIQAGTELIQVEDMKEIILGDNERLNIYSFIKQLDDTSNINNTSLMTKLYFKGSSFLFMADIESDLGKIILNNNLDISADVLKVAHHGSSDSSSNKFLKAVNPKIAVISVGLNNKFGHPSGRVVKRLKRNNINVYRTDFDGDIKIIINKNKQFIIRTSSQALEK